MQNKLKMNKKAISPVIAVTLIIIISIVSASILAVYVIRLAEKPAQFAPSVVSCIDMKSPPQIKSSCINQNDNRLEVTIDRSPIDDYTIILGFVVEGPAETEVYECGLSCEGSCIIQNPGQEKTFYFDISNQNPNKVNIYVNDNNCKIDESNIINC